MSEAIKSTIYEFGEFRLDAKKQKLFRRESGEIVLVQPKALELLLLLIENEGQILTRDEILDTLWAENFVEEANLTQTVFVLRKTLGEDKNERQFIATVPHRGYRFIGKVEKIKEISDSKFQISDSEIQKPKTKDQKPTPTKYFLLAIPVILLFGFGIYYFWQDKNPTPISEIKSIAVLPFTNIGGKEDEEYLGNGLSEVLISKLSNIKTIIVRPTSAVRKFTDASPDPKKIGSDLNVEAIITGRVQKVNENIRVTVQLVRVSDGATLWAETFDDKFTNIFAVQDSISEKVTQSLALKLTSDERQQVAKSYTTNSEAFQIYLQGRFMWNKRTPDILTKAVAEFEKAKQIDPNFALAYVGLADCYVLLAEYRVMPPNESFPKARAAALKALEIDNRLAEARTSLAYILAFYDWDFPAAEREFKKTIEENPNHATSHQWYAELLADLGRFDEAHEQFAIARQIDPTSPIILGDISHIFFNQRKFDQAIEESRKCAALDPNFGFCYLNLGFAFEEKGMFAEAVETLNKAMLLLGEPPDVVEELKTAFAKSGIKGFWQKRLEQALTRPHLKNFPAQSVAVIYIRLGNKEKAFEWLNKSFQQRERYLVSMKYSPFYDPLRDEPRFQDLLRQMKL